MLSFFASNLQRGAPQWPRQVVLRTAAYLTIAVFAGALAWIRLPAGQHEIVWAEDGKLFLGELEHYGFWPTLFKPYAGYLQFWPRILVNIALTWGGLDRYAGAVAFAACAAVGAICAGVFVWARALIPSPHLRGLLAVLPVLVSTAPIEVLDNVANLHWFLIWGTAWLVIWRPLSWTSAACMSLLGATFSLTEIQVAIVAPFLLLNSRSGKAWVVRGGIGVGLAAQVIATLTHPRPSMQDHLGVLSVLQGYVLNGPFSLLFGDARLGGTVLATVGWPVGLLAVLPFAALLAAALTYGSREIRTVALVCAFMSVSTWVAAAYANLSPEVTPNFDYSQFTRDQFRSIGYFRYGFIPSLCLIVLTILAMQAMAASKHAARRRISLRSIGGLGLSKATRSGILLLAVGVLLIQVLYFIPRSTFRSGEPVWRASVAAARAECGTDSAQEVRIAQAPTGFGSWGVVLLCSQLREHS